MHLEDTQISAALGVALLAACSAYLSGRRRWASLGSSLVGAVIGGSAYTLALCLFMGFAGARAVQDDHGWSRFKYAFSVYAQASVTESLPRGAVMGAFVVAAWSFWRRGRASRRRGSTP